MYSLMSGRLAAATDLLCLKPVELCITMVGGPDILEYVRTATGTRGQ